VANIGDYAGTYAGFDWETPERFNFGRDVVDRWAAQDRPAMIWLGAGEAAEERRLDFAQFSILSNRFANAARTLGIERGDRVMVLLGKVPEWHVVLTGLLKLGAIAIPCAPQLRAGDLKFRAEHSGSVAMISGPEGFAEAEKMRAEAGLSALRYFVSVGAERDGWDPLEDLMDDASEGFDAEDTAADDGAFILYTSGTTKHPKGVLHTHGYTHAKWMQAKYWLDLQQGDRLWCTSGTGWAKSIWNVFLGPWSQGTEIFFHEGGFDPAERLDLIERYRITVLCQAPTEYRLLAKAPELERADLSSVRHAVSAGEPLNPPVIERWRICTASRSTTATARPRTPCSSPTTRSGGTPRLHGQAVPRLPRQGRGFGRRGVSAGRARRHRARGPHSLPLQRVLGTAGRDGGRLQGRPLPDRRQGLQGFGRVPVVRGRSDDVILSAGYRIGPFEVESVLIEHPAVVESAVVPAPDEDRGSVVKAYVVVGKDHEPSDALARRSRTTARRARPRTSTPAG
jgi:acyl-coenzyme A synthetase/AMP-(fatty) acid ligase